jgi:hypothetical protein
MSGEDTSSRVREKTNATQRLSTFILALSQYDSTSSEQLLDVERKVLQMNPTSGIWTDFDTTIAAASLLRNAEREIQVNLVGEVEFYTRSLGPLAEFLGVRRSISPWKVHRGGLRELFLSDIENAAQRLKSLVPEQELFDAELSPVLAEVDELLEEINQADLSPTARDRLLAKVQDLRFSIQEYQLGGSPAIRVALEAVVGTLVQDEPVRNEVVRTATAGAGLWRKLKKVVQAVVLLLGTANTIHDGAKNFIQPLEHILSLPSDRQESPKTDIAPNVGNNEFHATIDLIRTI